MTRHSIPERCNRPAHRMADNGYRTCPDHARINDPAFVLYENTVGPCDYPMDGLGAAPYAPGVSRDQALARSFYRARYDVYELNNPATRFSAQHSAQAYIRLMHKAKGV